MAGEIIFLVQEFPEGGYEARALGHAVFAEADDLQSLKEELRDAVPCHFDEGEREAVIRMHVVRGEVKEGGWYFEVEREVLSRQLFEDRE